MDTMSQTEGFVFIGNLIVPKNLCNLDDLREVIGKSLGGHLFENNDVDDHEDDDELSHHEDINEISHHENENKKQNHCGGTVGTGRGLQLNENMIHADMPQTREEVKLAENYFNEVGKNASLVKISLNDEAAIHDEEMDTNNPVKGEMNLEFLVIKPEVLETNDDDPILNENIGYHFLTQLQQAIDNNKNKSFSNPEDSDSDISQPKINYCPLCNYSKNYHLSVKRHIYIHHPEIDSQLPPAQRLSCNICHKRYYDSRHLQKHMKSLHGL